MTILMFVDLPISEFKELTYSMVPRNFSTHLATSLLGLSLSAILLFVVMLTTSYSTHFHILHSISSSELFIKLKSQFAALFLLPFFLIWIFTKRYTNTHSSLSKIITAAIFNALSFAVLTYTLYIAIYFHEFGNPPWVTWPFILTVMLMKALMMFVPVNDAKTQGDLR